MEPRIQVDIVELPALAQLEPLWRELETRGEPSFYTSWSWIGVWLATLPADLRPRLWRAQRGEQVVGLGVLVRSWRKRGPVPVCQAWHLNATGDFAQDVVWVEHNGLLVDRRWAAAIRTDMLSAWAATAGGASELRLPGLVDPGWSDAVGLERVVDTQPSCCVGLEAVRGHAMDFMPLVSGHARRFIRRSIKEYQTLGPLLLAEAQTAEEAWAWFERLADLNRLRRAAKGDTGAFDDPHFMAFHRRLIATCFARGEIQMLRLTAGERDVGLLYSFVHGRRVYVYQSGFDYGLLAKHGRPGMVAHTLAIQHNAAKGHDFYDLMAGGEGQYRATLSTVEETLAWVVLRKPALRFELEDRLYKIAKNHLAKSEPPRGDVRGDVREEA